VRLYITGGPGSGKTRAAQAVSSKLSVVAHCLDDVVWDNGDGMKNQRRPEAARDEAVRRIAAEPAWVVEGTYFQSWLRPILERVDCVVILATPRWRRLLRLSRRHFVERSPFRAPSDNLRLFVANARWGLSYEQHALPELIGSLEAESTPFVVHRSGDLLALVAELDRGRAPRSRNVVEG